MMRAESRLQFYQQVINKWNRDAASVVRDLENYLGGGGLFPGNQETPWIRHCMGTSGSSLMVTMYSSLKMQAT